MLVFIKDMTNAGLYPVFLREPRNALAAGINKNSLALTKKNATNASALEHQSGVGSEALTTSGSSKFQCVKGKLKSFPV